MGSRKAVNAKNGSSDGFFRSHLDVLRPLK